MSQGREKRQTLEILCVLYDLFMVDTSNLRERSRQLVQI